MFYAYRQNNSGGVFEDDILCVIIEADTPEQADRVAVENSIVYFNGVKKGLDCSCCGDRWRKVFDQGKEEFDIDNYVSTVCKSFYEGMTIVVYFKDGRIKEYDAVSGEILGVS